MDTNTVGLLWLWTNATFYQLQKNWLSLLLTETGGLYNRCVVSLQPVFFLWLDMKNMKRELINLSKALKKAVLFFILNFNYYKPYKCSNFINFWNHHKVRPKEGFN